MSERQGQTRIQRRNSAAILEAALEVFSARGYTGARLEMIASAAGMSKPNLLYYFSSKDAIYAALLNKHLDMWLDPLREIDPDGEPVDEMLRYVMRKLEMSREFPRESRVFANEILQGAPVIMTEIEGGLRKLVDEKARLLSDWMDQGRMARLEPRHLIFSIWATTQHYADFAPQVQGILGPSKDAHFGDARVFLADLYRGALTPKQAH